jgi:hypothetical protein
MPVVASGPRSRKVWKVGQSWSALRHDEEQLVIGSGKSKNAKNNLRHRRAEKMKDASRRVQLADQEDARRATLPSAQAAVDSAQPRADEVDLIAGDQVLQAQTVGPFQANAIGGMVAAFRPTMALAAATALVPSQPVRIVPRNGPSHTPLRVGLRTVLAGAVRRTALLALVTARANSNRSRSRSNPTQTQSPQPTNQNQGGAPSEEE